MTTPIDPEQAAAAPPVPVSGDVTVREIHGQVLTRPGAADFGAVFSVTYTGTEQPAQLLPYDANRRVAWITCTGTGPVWIAYRDPTGLNALRNSGVTGGQVPVFILATGLTLQLGHKQAVYIAPDGTHPATVSVSVERWQS